MANKLTPKQERFCLAYSATGNATQAYRDAGYDGKDDNVAYASSSRMLRDAKVKERLKEIDRETNTEKVLSVQGRKELLTKFAMDEEASMKDRMQAMDLLNKMGQVYIQRQEISGAIPVVLNDNVRE